MKLSAKEQYMSFMKPTSNRLMTPWGTQRHYWKSVGNMN